MEGKQGYVYLLDRDHLGGYLQGASGGDGVGRSHRAVRRRLEPARGVARRRGLRVLRDRERAGGQGAGTSGFLRAYKYGVDGAW